VEALILGYIFFKNDVKIFLNLGVIALGAGVFRLFFIDANIKTGNWLADSNTWVSTYTPIFNERTFIYFMGVISVFAMAYFAFYKNEKTVAK
jgi:hypothetical protein